MYQSHADQGPGPVGRKVLSHRPCWAPARSLGLGAAGRGWDPRLKYVTKRDGRPPLGSASPIRVGLGEVGAETWQQSKLQMRGLVAGGAEQAGPSTPDPDSQILRMGLNSMCYFVLPPRAQKS